jgi:hypothetical protein
MAALVRHLHGLIREDMQTVAVEWTGHFSQQIRVATITSRPFGGAHISRPVASVACKHATLTKGNLIMTGRLAGKVSVITGAGGGLGQAAGLSCPDWTRRQHRRADAHPLL